MITRAFHIVLISFICGCTVGGPNDANDWINSLEKGMTQEEVEASKPDHVTVHWDKPIPTDSVKTEYNVTYEGAEDLRSAPGPSPDFFLVFQDEMFVTYGGRN